MAALRVTLPAWNFRCWPSDAMELICPPTRRAQFPDYTYTCMLILEILIPYDARALIFVIRFPIFAKYKFK